MLEGLRDGVFLAPYDVWPAIGKLEGWTWQETVQRAALAVVRELEWPAWGAMQRDYARALTYDAVRLAELAARQLDIMQDV